MGSQGRRACDGVCARDVAAADSDSVVVLAEAAAVLPQPPVLDPTHSDPQDPSAFRALQVLHFHQAHYQHWDLRLAKELGKCNVIVSLENGFCEMTIAFPG